MEKSIHNELISELSILYEIASISSQATEEEIGKEGIERAIRLFGVHYFALLSGERVIISYGFRNPEKISIRIKQNRPNQIRFIFKAPEEQIILFMEQANPIGDRERRLYDIFAHRIEKALLATKNLIARKLIEDALQKSGEEFRLIFENAKDAIFWADPETGLITNCNKAAEELLEKERAEIIGRHQTTIHPPKKAQYFVEMFKYKGWADGEAEVITKSGKIVPVSITASVTLIRGRPIIQGIFHDLTEQKKMEKKLIETEKLAVAAQIASEIAHEVKNPLSVIKTGLYYLKKILIEELEPEKVQKSLSQMDRAVDRATSYINDLLNFSRPPMLKLMPVEINEILEESLKELPAEILSDIEVTMDLEPALPQIKADPQRLKQVFTNLIKNASEAMEKVESKELRVESRKEEGFVRISISDTGKGIPKENLKRIFDTFFTTKGKGTGLGLAICQRIIGAHKGRIEIVGEVGKGTTFIIRLKV